CHPALFHGLSVCENALRNRHPELVQSGGNYHAGAILFLGLPEPWSGTSLRVPAGAAGAVLWQLVPGDLRRARALLPVAAFDFGVRHPCGRNFSWSRTSLETLPGLLARRLFSQWDRMAFSRPALPPVLGLETRIEDGKATGA